MKNISSSIRDQVKAYLTFNYAERRGLMVLVVLIILTEGVNAVLPKLIKKEAFDESVFRENVRQFELALSRPDTLKADTTHRNSHIRKQYPNYTPYKKKVRPERPPVMIEINTADSAQLVKLYGIGPSFASRILKYRGMLGGFFSIEQLLEVYGMDSVRYAGIQKNVKADTSFILTIDVNTAEFKTLLHHPYLDYETVKLICNYREYSGPITCSDTLRKVIGYDPMYEKVRHYIEYRVSGIE
jgi:DNA uptake protein ComE-like DNA-binding protein